MPEHEPLFVLDDRIKGIIARTATDAKVAGNAEVKADRVLQLMITSGGFVLDDALAALGYNAFEVRARAAEVALTDASTTTTGSEQPFSDAVLHALRQGAKAGLNHGGAEAIATGSVIYSLLVTNDEFLDQSAGNFLDSLGLDRGRMRKEVSNLISLKVRNSE